MSSVLIHEFETEDEISNRIKELTEQNNDHFVCKLLRSYANQSYLHVPANFVFKNNLPEHCDSEDPSFKLRVEEHICKAPDWDKKRWQLKVIHHPGSDSKLRGSKTYFGHCWLKFSKDNGLQTGDHVVLRLDITVKEFVLVGVFRFKVPFAAPRHPKKKNDDTTSVQKRKQIDLTQGSAEKKKKNTAEEDVCNVDQIMMIQGVQTRKMSSSDKSSTSTSAQKKKNANADDVCNVDQIMMIQGVQTRKMSSGDKSSMSTSSQKKKNANADDVCNVDQIMMIQGVQTRKMSSGDKSSMSTSPQKKKNANADDVCNVDPKMVRFLKLMHQRAQSEAEDLRISTSLSVAEQLNRIVLQGGKLFNELMEISSIQSENLDEVDGWKKRAIDAETEVANHVRTADQLKAQVTAIEKERDNLSCKLSEMEEEHKKTLEELQVVVHREIESARNEAIQSFKASKEYGNILTKAAGDEKEKITVMMKKHLDGHEAENEEETIYA